MKREQIVDVWHSVIINLYNILQKLFFEIVKKSFRSMFCNTKNLLHTILFQSLYLKLNFHFI